jgi:hypothetical protein
MQKKNKIIHIIISLDKGGSAENTLLTVLGTNKKNGIGRRRCSHDF